MPSTVALVSSDMTKRIPKHTPLGAAAEIHPGRTATAIVAALLLIVLSAACGNSADDGDRGLIPSTNPALRPPVPSAGAPLTLGGDPFTIVDGVTVYDEIPPLLVNISQWRETDFHRFTVDPDEIISVGVGRNGILPIYQPIFISLLEAATLNWMTGDHPVAVVEVNGDARAYPLGILTFHEVVNDTIGGVPVLITYCPRCYTTLAFNRTVDGIELNFGTAGNLRLSNLIMWDDHTESWWQQADGQAIVGAAAGQRLEYIPAYTTSFREFARSYPNGTVLSPVSSRDANYWSMYGNSLYPAYDAPNNLPNLFVGQPDDRLGPKERILGVKVGDTAIAFPFGRLRQQRVINTEIGGEPIIVFWKPGTRSALDEEAIADSYDVGSAAAFSRRVGDTILTFEPNGEFFRDTETGTTWTLLGVGDEGPLAEQQLQPVRAENALWFAWAAFKPTTDVYTSAS